jgi:tetratricopeptide (TPR) repeat protein
MFLDMMEFKPAIMNYIKALSKNPELPDARKNTGYAFFQLGKADEAIGFLTRELALFPDNLDAFDLLVYFLFKSDRIQENLNFLETLDLDIQAEKKSQNAGLGDFILGMYFKERENYGKAIKFFREALERGYEPIKCYVQLLDIYLIQTEKRIERPMDGLPTHGLGKVILDEAIKTFGGTPSEIHFLYGLRYFENRSANVQFLYKSIESFELASRLKPDTDLKDALFNLACINYNRADYENASEYFRGVLKMEPENEKAKLYLNCCSWKHSKSKNRDSLDEQCPEWLKLSRDFIDKPAVEYEYKFKNDRKFVLQNINNLALEFVERGEFQEALQRFLNGLKIFPDSSVNDIEKAEKHALLALQKKDDKDAYNHLGTIYFRKREFHKSISVFEKTIEIDPKDPRGHFNLGCSYWELDNREKAEEEWKKAIKYEKASKKPKKKDYVSEDQLDLSLIVLEPEVSFKAHKYLGKLYLEKNLSDKALREFKMGLDLEPDDPEPYYEIGKIYKAKSERNKEYAEKAIYYFEKYLYLGGEKEEEVKKLLRALKIDEIPG